MKLTLLYFGPQWIGSTSLQRLRAFQRMDALRAVGIDSGAGVGNVTTLWRRVRWKLRVPVDVLGENRRLIAAVEKHRPDIVFVDNSKVTRCSTLRTLRRLGVRRLMYYSPDDIAAPHNLSVPLKWSLPDWDVVCTTKTFNVPELRALGVRRPLLVGKAYDPELHKPMTRETVGEEFERFDAVFVGTYEAERCASLNGLAKAGVSLAVYGTDKGGWQVERLHPSIVLRPSVFGEQYVAAWHTGKVALCFLRKLNRDRITQRTMEIAAIGRPMVGERTNEHDAHFKDGFEYIGFSSDAELLTAVQALLHSEARRRVLAEASRRRCLESGYSTDARAREMLAAIFET